MKTPKDSSSKRRDEDEKIDEKIAPIDPGLEDEALSNGTISSMEMTGIAPAAVPMDMGMPAFNQLWTNPTEMLGAEPEEDERSIHRKKKKK